MPAAVRTALIGLSLTFLTVGIYHRIRAAQSGDRLDRTKEGWPTLIGMRLAGLITFGSTAAWLWNPRWFAWAAVNITSLLDQSTKTDQNLHAEYCACLLKKVTLPARAHR